MGEPNAAQEALEALERLNAAVSTGVSIVSYTEEMIDAREAIDRYMASPEYGQNAEVGRQILEIYQRHERSLNLMKCKLEQDFDIEHECQDKELVEMMEHSELIHRKINEVLEQDQEAKYISTAVHVPAVLQINWNEARIETIELQKQRLRDLPEG